MTVVSEKYKTIQPTLEYLSDPVILAQAWKKSHSYIRSHNWYADTLELDCSSFNLEADLENTAQTIATGCYQSKPLQLVPAPKSDAWSFRCDDKSSSWLWAPRLTDNESPKELRPLAHVAIEDQTVATALMICLADAVETAQGSTDPENNHDVVSYGNRLYCEWNEDKARFRWGNTTTYSQYFQDYQRFLERPAHKAEEWMPLATVAGHALYEVQLDLSAFFDNIDRDKLIEELRSIAKKHYDLVGEKTNSFWHRASEIIKGWRWSPDAHDLTHCLKNNSLPEGLPQGLVASGFFANAYMISFDDSMKEKVGRVQGTYKLLDYCRYVDDMRLLVMAHPDNEASLASDICIKVNHLLPDNMSINPYKTEVTRYSAQSSQISARMQAIQSTASGPRDASVLNSMISSIEGLFALAELHQSNKDNPHRGCDIGLANVATPNIDVRDDTIMRFAANRWHRAITEKRGLTRPSDIPDLDQLYETVARRFIASWARNPSMLLLLKKAFSLFPSCTLLAPVKEALYTKVKQKNCSKNEQMVAWYCIAEIFRFGAIDANRIENGLLPEQSDLNGFFDAVCSFAEELLSSGISIPWYVHQQLMLLLAVHNRPQLTSHTIDQRYRLLHYSLAGLCFASPTSALTLRLPILLISWQMAESPRAIESQICVWLGCLLETECPDVCENILSNVALNNQDLFRELLLKARESSLVWLPIAEKVREELGLTENVTHDFEKRRDSMPLLSVISLPNSNPFQHENALLFLAKKLLVEHSIELKNASISPPALSVRSDNWGRIQDPSIAHLELSIDSTTYHDFRFTTPAWVGADSDSCALYQLGCILRACAIGSPDFTTSQFLLRSDTSSGYFGLKSSWFKRRLGMMHSPEALNGDVAPMSTWVTELLFHLLQWPGLEVHAHQESWPEKWTIETVLHVIEQRLQYQADLYGSASQLPLYVQRIKHPLGDRSKLRVVMAQSLLPQKQDFENAGLTLDDPDYRIIHKNHLATMSCLINDKLRAVYSLRSAVPPKKPWVDLIVLPELAVHPDDIHILKSLADTTGAMIYTGLVFQDHGGRLINTAQWLIPWRNSTGRRWISRWQGKFHMTKPEKRIGIQPWRPYQLLIELDDSLPGHHRGFRLSGTICYDSTDLKLAADLRDHSDAFLIAALNQDITTFDNMVDALHYHMYQHVVLVNTGEFGGSVAQAPYKEYHKKQIAHSHGSNQISINLFEMDMHDFTIGGTSSPHPKEGVNMNAKKTPPAGSQKLSMSQEIA